MTARRLLLVVALTAGCGPGAASPPPPVVPPVGSGPGVEPSPPAQIGVRIGTVALVRRPAQAPAVAGGGAVAGVGDAPGGGGGSGTLLGPGHPGTGGVRLPPPVFQPPKVNPGAPQVYGGLDKDLIRRVIRRQLARLRYCYEKALVRNPGLTVNARTEFTIGPNGAVISASVRGIDPALASCLEGVLRSMQFPAPQGGGAVRIMYPFVFQPAPGATPGTGTPGPGSRPGKPTGPVAPSTEDRLVATTRCETTEAPDALHAALPGLRDCYLTALAGSPALAGTMVVEIQHRGDGAAPAVVVSGMDDPTLDACVTNRLAAVAPPDGADLAFTVGFLTDTLPSDATDVTVGAETLRVGVVQRGARLRDWQRAAGWAASLVDKVATELGTGTTVVLHGDDDAPALAVARTAERLRQGGIRVIVARRQRHRWTSQAVIPPQRPWRVMCPDGFEPLSAPTMGLAVLVTAGGIRLETDEQSQTIASTAAGQNTIDYARALRDLRRGELVSRADVEIAATHGVAWPDLARAIDVAVDTGFFELDLVAEPSDD